jgi:hypothetical protein
MSNLFIEFLKFEANDKLMDKIYRKLQKTQNIKSY